MKLGSERGAVDQGANTQYFTNNHRRGPAKQKQLAIPTSTSARSQSSPATRREFPSVPAIARTGRPGTNSTGGWFGGCDTNQERKGLSWVVSPLDRSQLSERAGAAHPEIEAFFATRKGRVEDTPKGYAGFESTSGVSRLRPKSSRVWEAKFEQSDCNPSRNSQPVGT